MSNKVSKKPSYQQIEINDDTDLETDPLNKQTEEDTSTHKQQTFCEWLVSNPFSKGPFLYFVVAIGASAGNAVFYLMDNDTAYIIAGIVGICVCVYGFKHFYTLLGLKQQVDKYGKLNLKFTKERKMLSSAVDRIETANVHLNETHERLQAANEKNRENLTQFREIQSNMNALGKESVAQMQDVVNRSKAIENKWHEEVFEHERNLLTVVFERMERQGSRRGMNQQEFQEFESNLPVGYKHRFDRMGTFHKLSGGESLIQYDDFRCALDVFAEMSTDNVDIEFEIEKTPKKNSRSNRNSKQIKFRGMEPLDENDSIDNTQNKEQLPQQLILISPKISRLTETESIDLEDIKFDESNSDHEMDEKDDAPALYDRKVVITKRTLRGSKMQEDLSMASININDDEYDNMNGSNSDDDDARKSMFGSAQSTPQTPGIRLEKREWQIPDKNELNVSNVSLKSMGKKQFANLLDDVDNQ